jgi:hypothetical protein
MFQKPAPKKFKFGQLVVVSMFGASFMATVREQEAKKITVFDGQHKRDVKPEACEKFVCQ